MQHLHDTRDAEWGGGGVTQIYTHNMMYNNYTQPVSSTYLPWYLDKNMIDHGMLNDY